MKKKDFKDFLIGLAVVVLLPIWLPIFFLYLCYIFMATLGEDTFSLVQTELILYKMKRDNRG